MVTITFTLSASELSLVADALCAKWGYDGDPSDTSAKNAFAKASLINYIKKITFDYEKSLITFTPSPLAIA